MKTNRAISFILVLCLLILLTGCSSEVENAHSGEEDSEGAVLYDCVSIPLPEDYFIVGSPAVDGAHLYLSGRSMLAEDDETEKIFVYDREFRRQHVIPLTDDGIFTRFPCDICTDGLGNVWVLESLSEIGNSSDIAAWRIEMFSADGKTRKDFELISDIAFPTQLKADGEYLYLYGADKDDKGILSVYDREAKLRFSLTELEMLSGIFFSAEGELCLCTSGLDKGEIKKLDTDSAKLVDVCAVENDEATALQGKSARMYDGYEYDCYMVSEGWLCGFSFENGEKTPICTLENYDFALRATDYIPLGDGEFLARSSQELVRLYPSDIPAEDITTLTLGTFDAKFLTAAVQKFNEENSACRINIVDYSKYDRSLNSGDGLRRLNTEIISGGGPDILDLCSLPASTYEKAGLLCDLYPFIDTDPTFKKMEFVSPVIDVLETDGSLYSLVPAYTVMTFVGNGRLGGDNSLSLSRLLELAEQMPESKNPFGMILTKRDFLDSILSVADSGFIDYNGKTGSFESPEFGALLELAAVLPDEADGSENFQMIASGEQLLSVNHFGGYGSLVAWNYIFGNDISFLGVPADESAGAIICPYISLGINKNCTAQEEAWSFLRSFLSDEYQLRAAENLLPISRKAMDFKQGSFKVWMDKGGIFSLIGADGNEVSFPVTGTAPFDMMDRLLSCISSVYDEKRELCDIIWSDAKAYFAGDKSLRETQAMIQSRAGIYIAEQYG